MPIHKKIKKLPSYEVAMAKSTKLYLRYPKRLRDRLYYQNGELHLTPRGLEIAREIGFTA